MSLPLHADPRSRLPRTDAPQTNIDDSFLDDLLSDKPLAFVGPGGSILDEVLLDHRTASGIDDQHYK